MVFSLPQFAPVAAKRLTRDDEASDADLRVLARGAVQHAGSSAQAPCTRCRRAWFIAWRRMTCALSPTRARAVGHAARSLSGMPPHILARLPEAARRALTQAAAWTMDAAADALRGMPPRVVARLLVDDRRALTPMAARDPYRATQALGDMPSRVIESLPKDALGALLQAATQSARQTPIG
jgi:hypothetical protein